MMDACAECTYSELTFSDFDSEGPLLKCWRYPPVLFVIHGELSQSSPDASQLCGEFSPSGVTAGGEPDE